MWIGTDDVPMPIAAQLNIWKRDHCHGAFQVPVDLVVSPNDDIASRMLNQQWVKELEISFKKFQTVNEDVHLVLRTTRELPPNPTIQDFIDLGVPFECVAGNHTSHALQACHSNFPKNPNYASLKASIYVCPNIPDNRDMLRALGNLDNVIKATMRKPSKSEIVLQAHKQLIIEAKLCTNKTERSRRVRQILSVIQSTHDINKNTWGPMAKIAKMEGEVWDLISQLLTGNGMPDSYSPPTTLSHFNQLGSLPEKMQIRLLRSAVKLEITLRELNSACITEKARKRVRDFVKSELRECSEKLSASKVDEMKWNALQQYYPRTTNGAMLDTFILEISTSIALDKTTSAYRC